MLQRFHNPIEIGNVINSGNSARISVYFSGRIIEQYDFSLVGSKVLEFNGFGKPLVESPVYLFNLKVSEYSPSSRRLEIVSDETSNIAVFEHEGKLRAQRTLAQVANNIRDELRNRDPETFSQTNYSGAKIA